MTRGRFRASMLLSGLLLGCVSAQIVRAQSAEAPKEGLRAGQRPPSFSVEDLDGASHTLEDYRGQVLVLHFWASWCPFCRGEIPKLRRLHEEWAQRGVRVLAVSVDAHPDRLRQFIAQAKLPYPIVADVERQASLASVYEVSGLPTTYLIGPDGRIILETAGQFDLLDAVDHALKQKPPASSS